MFKTLLRMYTLVCSSNKMRGIDPRNSDIVNDVARCEPPGVCSPRCGAPPEPGQSDTVRFIFTAEQRQPAGETISDPMELRSRQQIDATSCQRPSYSGLAHSWRPGRRSPRCDEGARRWLSRGRGHGHLRLEELATASFVHHGSEGTDAGGEGSQLGDAARIASRLALPASVTAELSSGDDACGQRPASRTVP